MRTKNAKRLWPVPVTLTVVALAAFLAFGLLATTGTQSVSADQISQRTEEAHCEDGMDNAHAGSSAADIVCATLANTFDVKFLGAATDTPTGLYVYSTGTGNRPEGSVIKEDVDVNTSGDNDSAGAEVVESPSTEEILDLAEIGLEIADQGSLKRVQSATVTISRDDMDSKGQVRLFVFAPTVLEEDRIEPVVTTGTLNKVADLGDNHYMVTVQFLGSPVLEVPDAGDVNNDGSGDGGVDGVIPGNGIIEEDTEDEGTDEKPDPRSTLMAYSLTDGDRAETGMRKKHELKADDDDGIVIVASMVDANDRALNDGDKDIESYVTFTVIYDTGSDLNSRVSLETVAVITVGDNNVADGEDNNKNHEAELKLADWRSGEKPVKATISVVYSGPTGPLTFPDFVVYRSGETTAADFASYTCVPLGTATAKTGDGCLATMKPVADTVVGRGQQFVIVGQLEDALGNKASGTTTPMVTLSNTAAFTEISSTADGETKRYMVSDKAAFQDYTITLSHGSGEDKVEQMLAVTVSGPPAEFQLVEPPMYISLGTTASAAFTVKAVDENGNIAHIITDVNDAMKNDTVDVVVRGVSQNDIRGLSDGKLKLDEHTGEGTFRVFAPLTASRGNQALLIIGSGDMEITHSIMFGEPFMAPGMPMNVMAEATSYSEVTVSWESPADDGGSAVTGYVLQSKTGTMDFMTIAASSAEIWWNTLDCQMMNAEIPDDATPAPPMDDTDMTSPYCAMYAGLSAEATTVVDGVFADEYGTISGTSHSDMDLMAETTYYYRVSAINSVGKGEYSDGMAMAMTMAENMAPMAGDDVADQMVYVGAMVEVQSNFSDPDEDMLSYMASSSDDMIATATVDDMGMVTITGVAEGMATITVTASDPMGESAMQTIMVNVMMALPMELGAPSITNVMSDAEGMATVMLMPGDNATKHYIWAQPTDLSQGMYSDKAAGDADMVTISGLTSGMNYWFIAVAGRGTGTDSEWSDWSGWTAETPIQ